MNRAGAMGVLVALLTTPVHSEQGSAWSDFIEQALTTCHDGAYALSDVEVEEHSIWFRAGPNEYRVYFGSVGVDLREVGSQGRSYYRGGQLTLTCANTLACVSAGAYDEASAQARARFGIVVLSPRQLTNQSMSLQCSDLTVAKGLDVALRRFNALAAPLRLAP